MKLNRRGRLARSVLILIVSVIAIQFFATHHRVYGDCYQGDMGWTCTLIKWERNK